MIRITNDSDDIMINDNDSDDTNDTVAGVQTPQEQGGADPGQ